MTKKFNRKGLPTDAELLREISYLWSYDSGNGGFTWVNRRTHNQPKPGRAVGGSDGRGYQMCIVLGHKFKVHQMVWLWHHKELPRQMLDHINGARSDNRIENLRLCDSSLNVHNSKRLLSPDRGYRICAKTGRYRVKIVVRGKTITVGSYDTQEEAHAAYIAAKDRVLGDFSPTYAPCKIAVSRCVVDVTEDSDVLVPG